MYKDVVFADEKRVLRDEDVLEEARAIRATGAGITGGDPLDAVERTCRYIRLLKGEFGPGFHTHLYTMSTDPDKIRALADAGLDEIRFHVPPGLWSRAAASAFVPASRLARSLALTVGIEVPLIPEREEVRHRVPKDLMGLDDARNRLEVAPWILQEIAPILGRPAFLVEEYPTADGLEVERTRLA